MPQTEAVLRQFADQAAACDQLGSPFTARLCRLLARRLDGRSRFGARILNWDGDPYADNVALRACGAIHALARSGWEPALTAVYPPNPTNENAVWAALADALQHNDSFLTDRLSGAPQTNEVARSALILGGMLHVARITGHPLEILEIGASAGLNLGFDGYRYDLGQGRHWGATDAQLEIECAWSGHLPPLDAQLSVVARHGCDLHPIDPGKTSDRERLLSYVWADQRHRLERVELALAIAAARKRQIDEMDAAAWTEARLAQPQRAGTTRVLFHTIVWQYLPPSVRARIESALTKAAGSASAEKPLARLSIEGDEVPGSARIDLTIWPEGRTITLGRGDFHGRSAVWA